MGRTRASLRPALLLAGALVNVAAAAVDGERIANQGNRTGASACIACHAQGGLGQAAAGFPYLAGMNRQYLVRQLEAFKTGARISPVMQPIADALSPEEVEAVAGYYSALPLPEEGMGEKGAPPLMARARRIMTSGKWQQAGMPACVACHGPKGQGVGAHFPIIVGQPAAYVEGQLEAWRQGRRTSDPNELMKAVAEKLDPEEIEALAAYLAAQSPAAAEAPPARAPTAGNAQ